MCRTAVSACAEGCACVWGHARRALALAQELVSLMSRVASVCITLLDNELVADMENKELLRQAAHIVIDMLHMLNGCRTSMHPHAACTGVEHSMFHPGYVQHTCSKSLTKASIAFLG